MENNSNPLDIYFNTLFENQKQAYREIIREEIEAALQKDLKEKLLSPKHVTELFKPKISLPTLARWSDQGLLKRYNLGGKIFYKYSEVIGSLKTLKKYTVT